MKTPFKIAACLVLLGSLVMPARGQESAVADLTVQINGFERAAHSSFVGVPTDWSTGHIVYSAPPPGSELEDKVQQDARYWLQQIRRAQLGSEDSMVVVDDVGAVSGQKKKKPKKVKIKKVKIKKDWSQTLGAAGATVGPNYFPAKYSYSTNPGAVSCSDYVAYNTSKGGSGTQASIIAFTNIYVGGCGGTTPTVAWAYNTGGTVSTSVTPSLDGTQLVFVHSAAGGASLEILRPVNGQGTSATTPVAPGTSTTTASTYVTCKAGAGSCLLSLAFSGAPNDTHSSPYYVFSGTDADVVFVGDDSGSVHKFIHVFSGMPSEVTTGGFPFKAASVPISGAIYNEVSGTVSVAASYDGTNNGGRLHEVSVDVTPTAANSKLLGSTTTGGVNCAGTTVGSGTALTLDAPLVDPTAGTNGTIYVFIGNDGEATPMSAVYQFASGSVSNACGSKLNVGTGSTTSAIPVYSGTFDNIYYTSEASQTGNSPTGNLYVCGNAGGDPTLYRIPIASNAFGTVSTGPVLTTGAATCSPVTEFLNGSTDRAYLSVTANGKTAAPVGCPAGGPSGCLMSFTLGASTPAGTTAAVAESGGTSGIVIDNSGATTGASQIYFSMLGAATAVQASQAGLN